MAVEITLRSMKTGDLESIAEIANTEDGWNICPSDYKIWAKIFNQKSLIVAEHDGEHQSCKLKKRKQY